MDSEHDFQTIYEEYYQKIIQYLTRIAGPNDAEDIAQDVFDKINRNLGAFRGQSKLSTWIYRIATNTAIDRMRSAAHKYAQGCTTIDEADDARPENGGVAHKEAAADQTLIRKEMSECVLEFIDKLPPDDRTVIVLSEIEGLTNKEIADIIGISLDNAKIRLHRARARLRTLLNKGCDFYHNEENVLACDRKPSQILPKPPGGLRSS